MRRINCWTLETIILITNVFSHICLCHNLLSEVLECFKRRELLDWATFQSKYGAALREGVPDCPATGVFAADEELGREQWDDLRKRVIEHVSVDISESLNM